MTGTDMCRRHSDNTLAAAEAEAAAAPTASTHLNGVGEGQADRGSTQLGPHHHTEDADTQHQDGTVQVTVEGQPQVEGLSVEQGTVVLVNLVGGGGDEVFVLAEGSHNGQALQGLSNQTNQVTWCNQAAEQAGRHRSASWLQNKRVWLAGVNMLLVLQDEICC
jgi:hypothetical protein